MPRVKGGSVTRRRRKKILKLAKGYFGSKRTLYRTAHEQVMRALAYQYRDRKQRKRQFRKLWISRINAAAKLNGMKYSTLIHGLALAGVEVNRKMLADIAVFAPADFTAYAELAKNALANPTAKKEVKVETKKEAKVEVKAEAKKETKATKKEVSTLIPYEKQLVAVLKEEAAKRGIVGASKMLKADLVAALIADDNK